MNISVRRIYGIVLRHVYNFYHNWDRVVDAFYWPSMDIVILGLTIFSLTKNGPDGSYAVSMILCAVILWYVLWRGQGEVTVNLLEEFWSENLVNLFSTPLSRLEWVISLLTLGFIKVVLSVLFTSLVAFLFYSVNILTLGPWLIVFIMSLLMMGWAFGLFIGGLFLRHGTNIQTLAWAGGFVLMPFSAVYYPLSTLPQWVQNVSKFLPSSYVFEGMRSYLLTGTVSPQIIGSMFLLNGIYLLLGFWFFIRSFTAAMERGIAHVK